MPEAVVPGAGPTRRRLLAAGLGAGLLTLTGGLRDSASPAHADAPEDEQTLLTKLATVELLGIVVQERVLDGGQLGPRAARATRRILTQERVHVALLAHELHRLGVSLPVAPRDTAEIDRLFAIHRVSTTVDDIHDEKHALDLLLSAESLAEGACYAAMSKLTAPRLQSLVSRLLASEAQHEAVLGLLRDPKDANRAAPYSFVEGIR